MHTMYTFINPLSKEEVEEGLRHCKEDKGPVLYKYAGQYFERALQTIQRLLGNKSDTKIEYYAPQVGTMCACMGPEECGTICGFVVDYVKTHWYVVYDHNDNIVEVVKGLERATEIKEWTIGGTIHECQILPLREVEVKKEDLEIAFRAAEEAERYKNDR